MKFTVGVQSFERSMFIFIRDTSHSTADRPDDVLLLDTPNYKTYYGKRIFKGYIEDSPYSIPTVHYSGSHDQLLC